jgi:hypothetical protein
MALKSVVSSLFSIALKKDSLFFYWALQKCSPVLILLSYSNALLRGHSSHWPVQLKSSLVYHGSDWPLLSSMYDQFFPPSFQTGCPRS